MAGTRDGILEVVGAGAGVADPADRTAVPDVDAQRRTGGEEVDEVGPPQLVRRGPPHLDPVAHAFAADPDDPFREPVEAWVPFAEHRERASTVVTGCRAGRPGMDREGGAGEPGEVVGARGGQPGRGHDPAVRRGEHGRRQHRVWRALPRTDDEHGVGSIGEVGEHRRAATRDRAGPRDEPQPRPRPPVVEERGQGVDRRRVGDDRDRAPAHLPLLPDLAHAARTRST